MNFPVYLLLYLSVLNLIGFLTCWSDKRRAQKGHWRISEMTLLLVGLSGGSFGLLLGMQLFRHKTKHQKFTLLVPVECFVWGIVIIHAVSAVTLDRQVQYRNISYASSKISPELDGYLIAFITDTHSISAEELRAVAEKINQLAPDLLLLGGDFPSYGEASERSMSILSQIRTADGIFGVEGNHDNYTKLFAAMERKGVKPLSNNGVRIGDWIYLAGVEDLWNRVPDIAKSVEGARKDDFVLLLAHNPDITMLQDTAMIDLTLSGHTHGGQITLFGCFAPALAWTNGITEYGQHFQSGWAKSRDQTDVFVSNGTGYLTNVPRVFARPQVILLTLRHSEL